MESFNWLHTQYHICLYQVLNLGKLLINMLRLQEHQHWSSETAVCTFYDHSNDIICKHSVSSVQCFLTCFVLIVKVLFSCWCFTTNYSMSKQKDWCRCDNSTGDAKSFWTTNSMSGVSRGPYFSWRHCAVAQCCTPIRHGTVRVRELCRACLININDSGFASLTSLYLNAIRFSLVQKQYIEGTLKCIHIGLHDWYDQVVIWDVPLWYIKCL